MQNNLSFEQQLILLFETDSTINEGLMNHLNKLILSGLLTFLPFSSHASQDSLIKQLIRHEGLNNNVYVDSEGYKTIGIGFNLDANKEFAKKMFKEWGLDFNDIYNGKDNLTSKQITELFNYSLKIATETAKQYLGESEFNKQPEKVQEVLINMAFNLGNRLNEFKKTKAYLLANDYENAAKEMLDSKWAEQVGNRAIELSKIIKSLSIQHKK